MEIVTSKTIARKDGCKSTFEWLQKAALRRGYTLKNQIGKLPVRARIDHGRWIADCECKGAEYVDPDEPIFFCLSCLNVNHGGKLRPVVFPPVKVRKKIETELEAKNFNSWNEKEEPYGL